MSIKSALSIVAEGRDLSSAEMMSAMREMMTGAATPAQIGGLLMALRVKGETVDEIVAAASVMRELSTKVDVHDTHLVDTCGTGGDSKGTFNISTACAFVAAAGGARVAKHGNRSVSSTTGSADVLEAAGVRLDLNADQVTQCIAELGIGFLFAPAHHNAMKHAIGPRKELGLRTLFNLIGPLTNPASAPRQVMGVFSQTWVNPICQVLQKLGSTQVMVVHSDDGMDEISVADATQVSELRDGEVLNYSIQPEDFGIKRQGLDPLVVEDAQDSLNLIGEALQGRPGPARDIVALNGGAAIYVSGIAEDLKSGVAQAQDILASGAAWEKLKALSEFTQWLANSE